MVHHLPRYDSQHGFATRTSSATPHRCPQARLAQLLLCGAGLAQLKEGQGGVAVRLLEQSKVSASESIPLAAAYNKAEPSTPAAEHTEFDHDLRICVDSALARVSVCSHD